MIALLLGRFHALTRTQADWLAALEREPDIDRVMCVLTSADHHGTRRNPLPVALRRAMVEPPLARATKPFDIVAIDDISDSEAWVKYVCDRVEATVGRALSPGDTQVFTANRDVDALFGRAGFRVVSQAVSGPTPHEIIRRIVDGKPWEADAAPSMLDVYRAHDVPATLRAIYGQTLVNDDGELGHARDFASYGAQMDAALRQKLDDLLPWVEPGLVVDKGCGTGMLLVELAQRFPRSAFVGVDLSRELLRRCDENTYAAQDVSFVAADITMAQVAPASASTIVLSSVVHEIYSYSGYDRDRVRLALRNAAGELRSGGRVLIRDGISPGSARWRLRFLDEPTRQQFARFAAEFKHGQGAAHERAADGDVWLSAHLANEFLCKKDYLKNWHIEVHEEYGTFTLDEWRTVLAEVGLECLQARGYVNEWIAEHRYAGHAELYDESGRALPWPATNAVIIGQKASS